MQKTIDKAKNLFMQSEDDWASDRQTNATLHALQCQAAAQIAIAELLAKLVDQLDNVTGANDGELNIRVHDIGR